uniref:Mitochondrial import inner membrane translocase subunit tim23 n=1 Tax=Anthurium amnicola TaxID=1678845 RepID=A0A1D1XGI7_9ARAE
MADPRGFSGRDGIFPSSWGAAAAGADHGQDPDGPSVVRRYNPYKDLQIPYQTIYNLPTSPEFLFQEESLAQRRSWGENLTYYTGCGYLSGAVAGASKGLYEAIRAAEPGDTLKLRVNRILNTSGQAGRRVGNRLGVIGLMYAGLESGMMMARGSDDWMNSVVAGLGTGALFKAASGPRSAAVAGAIGGLMVGAAVAGKQVVKRYVPI